MASIKFSALVFIASITCLDLLPAPGSNRVEAPAGATAPEGLEDASWKRQPSAPRIESAPMTLPVIDGSQPPALAAAGFSATPPAPTRSIDWLEALFPELARISELEDVPADTALAELVPMLASEYPAIRLAAIESVGDMSIAEVAPVLTMALGDPEPQVRVAALQALAARNDEAVSASIEPCLYDHDLEVRLAAIDALAALEAKSAVYTIAGLLSDPEISIRRHAVYALGDIGGQSAMRFLRQARHDPDDAVRMDADAVLAESNHDAHR